MLIVEARDITIDGAVRALRALRDGDAKAGQSASDLDQER
jgi:hypothetical protein